MKDISVRVTSIKLEYVNVGAAYDYLPVYVIGRAFAKSHVIVGYHDMTVQTVLTDAEMKQLSTLLDGISDRIKAELA